MDSKQFGAAPGSSSSVNVANLAYKPVRGAPRQFAAMFWKNVALQKRQKRTNCCQIIFPIIMILVVVIFQAVFDAFQSGSSNPSVATFGYPLNIFSSVAPVSMIFGSNPHFYYVDNTADGMAGYLSANGSKDGLLSYFPQVNVSGSYKPYFTKFSTVSEMSSTLATDIGKARLQLRDNENSQGANALPVVPTTSGAFVFTTSNTTIDGGLTATFVYNNETNTYECQTVMPKSLWGLCSLWEYFHVTSQVNMLSNAFARSTAGLKISAQFTAVPTYGASVAFAVKELVAGLLIPVTLIFLIPVFVYNVVIEKEQKLRELMRMMGLHIRYYWIVAIIFNYILYLIVAFVFIIMGNIISLQFFRQTGYGIIFAILLGWGFTQIAFSFTISAFLNKALTARVTAYAIVLASWIIGFVIENFTYSDGREPSPAFMLYPPFALFHSLFLCFRACSNGACLKNQDLVPGSQIAKSIGWIWGEAVLFFLLAFYLDAVLPREFGISEHPLFFIHWFTKRGEQKKVPRTTTAPVQQPKDLNPAELTIMVGEKVAPIDSDVLEEENRVESGILPPNCLIAMNGLSKTYPNGKKALEKISLGIPENECFGLLGMNGAGKSTTINMLCGLFLPTHGYATLNGFDVETEIHKVHANLGVCPQFDTLFEDMTCREHLLLYSRLKGIQNEAVHAQKYLEYVGLAQDGDKLVRQLSGGMKRRLSIAIAFIGDPKIVFLDEPTTGLDPTTRRLLWDFIFASKTGRAIVLTTHSMEEADVLCDRIGIMSRGRMRCLGTQVRLKNKFGDGLKLSIRYDAAQEQNAHGVVRQIVSAASLESSFIGTATFVIPTGHIKLSQLFSEMSKWKGRAGIKDFGVSQTSLEDVFLSVVKGETQNMNALETLSKGLCAKLFKFICCCKCK